MRSIQGIASLSFLIIALPSIVFAQIGTTATDGSANPPDPSVVFVTGPATPPFGAGSAEYRVGADGSQASEIYRTDYASTPVNSISEFRYSTYVQSGGSGEKAPYIILRLDYNNDGLQDDLLFFEPVYQSSAFFPSNPQPSVTAGMWQTWDAANGGWYSLGDQGVPGFTPTGAMATPGAGVKSLSTILTSQPGARIVNDIAAAAPGGIRFVAGFEAGAWDNFIGNLDFVQIRTSNRNGTGMSSNVTTNFEPISVSINDVTANEGDSATTNFDFIVLLQAPSPIPVSVPFTVTPGTATTPADYTVVTPSPLMFAPGVSSQTIRVAVVADLIFEGDETFTITLGQPTNARVNDGTGVGTITNDDGADVSIVKTGPATGFTSTATMFNITVSNAGPFVATGVTVTDVLPAGATGFGTPSQGSCSGTTTITCNLGTIAVSGTATIALNVTTPATGTSFMNTATVTANEGDPNPANNTSTTTTTLVSATSIPTLSQWVLVALAGALALVAAVKLRM